MQLNELMQEIHKLHARRRAGKCPFCNKPMDGTWRSFRDERSYKEYQITRVCQACQDETYELSER